MNHRPLAALKAILLEGTASPDALAKEARADRITNITDQARFCGDPRIVAIEAEIAKNPNSPIAQFNLTALTGML